MERLKKAGSILSTIVLVLLIAAVAALAVPRLMGVEIRAVVSGSMAPEYNVGDLVYAVPTDFEDIETGDVISFVLNEELTVVTHRVVEIDYENQQFYTQGDANNTRDGSPVRYENTLGVVRFSVPYAGRLVAVLEDPSYRILAITAVAVLILLMIIIMINTGGEEEEEELQEIGHEAAAAVSTGQPLNEGISQAQRSTPYQRRSTQPEGKLKSILKSETLFAWVMAILVFVIAAGIIIVTFLDI